MEKPFRHVPDGTRLIETMLWQPGGGVALAARHRDRLCLSARRLGFDFDPSTFYRALNEVSGDAPRRLRLTLDASGVVDMSCAPAPSPAMLWRVAVAPHRLASDDPWLRVKSTRRAIYDAARADLPDGVDELIFLNEDGHLAEGTICNVLVERDDGWVTPPLTDGALPGVMRAELLARGEVRVASVTLKQLTAAPRLRLCNALRGQIEARLVPYVSEDATQSAK
ncbi:4-amino-4-deoxychorismate lyase [Sagittula marina]|uniref:Probable branched-chain-amino-acid aminotransferase n=1 Tax=Sagittula marina TaxID=943940 RepID=A0A7W6DQM3_9RHOB|nr:4-amino-4-deoxychorismate lyase [Sagittula marina]